MQFFPRIEKELQASMFPPFLCIILYNSDDYLCQHLDFLPPLFRCWKVQGDWTHDSCFLFLSYDGVGIIEICRHVQLMYLVSSYPCEAEEG